MEGFKVLGFDHVFLCPKDWHKSMTFWRDRLGLSVQDDWSDESYHGAALSVGDSRITIAQAEAERDREVGFRVERGQPYLYLKVQGLDAILAHLRSHGVEVLSGPVRLHWGPRMASVRDPDGIPVMLVEG